MAPRDTSECKDTCSARACQPRCAGRDGSWARRSGWWRRWLRAAMTAAPAIRFADELPADESPYVHRGARLPGPRPR